MLLSMSILADNIVQQKVTVSKQLKPGFTCGSCVSSREVVYAPTLEVFKVGRSFEQSLLVGRVSACGRGIGTG